MNIENVAALLVSKAGREISHKELQKLLYLAQGFYLATNNGEALFDDDFEAWEHGPVSQRIWHKYKHLGYYSIPKEAALPNATPQTMAFIAALLLAFSGISQNKLIDYSHADSPWASNYIPANNRPLSKVELHQYFSNFASFEDYIAANEQKAAFSKLLRERENYISDLPKIGNDWISGRAQAPNKDVSSLARHFLTNLERVLFSNHAKPEIPTIVMGPIPSGGIGIDLKKASRGLYVHFHNNGLVEVAEEDSHGNFTEDEMMADDFSAELGVYLRDFC